MRVKFYVGPKWTIISHATPNYGLVKYRFEVDYYIQTYYSPEKVAHLRKKWRNQVEK